jgi:hypothetical protein
MDEDGGALAVAGGGARARGEPTLGGLGCGKRWDEERGGPRAPFLYPGGLGKQGKGGRLRSIRFG